MTIRVLVIDDHPLVRAGVRSELEKSDVIEVVGDAALCIAPEDTEALVAALEQGLQDEAWRSQASIAGLKRATHFSWERCINQTVDVYRQVSSGLLLSTGVIQ